MEGSREGVEGSERVRERCYHDAKSSVGQAPWVVESNRPSADWPQHGEVEFRNYSVRYRPGLDLVLQDLSLHVAGGEKVCGVWVLALWWLGGLLVLLSSCRAAL